MKTCKQCQTTKQIQEFPKNGSSYRSRCKICHNNHKSGLRAAQKVKDKEMRVNKIKSVLGGLK